MQYHDFVGEVQHRARLATTEEAVTAIRATLTTLSERLHHGEATDLAAQLPDEIGAFLRDTKTDERFSLDEFFQRVAERAGIDKPDAAYHARAVVSVLQEAATRGEMENVRSQLPESYAPLFEAGHEGGMST